MLRALSIENIAVAKQLYAEFTDGFSVVTGETGAGKSVLIDCMNLAVGGKSRREMVRSGERDGTVTALFNVTDTEAAELEAAGISADENGDILLTRTVTPDGRSTARINSRSVPVSHLRDAGRILMDIYEQDDSRILSDRSEYIGILDGYADDAALIAEYGKSYAKLGNVKNELDALLDDMKEREMLVDILKYQTGEIKAARLTDENEEEKLIALRTRVKSAGQIAKYSSVVYRALCDNEKASAAYLMERASAALSGLEGVMDGVPELVEKLNSMRYEVIDIGERAKDLSDSDEVQNPDAELDKIESRLSLISKLEKKYGATIADVNEFYRGAVHRLDELESGEMRQSELERKISAATIECKSAAKRITDARKSAAAELEREIASSLVFLDMAKVKLTVSVTDSKELQSDGADTVDFLISTNPGEPMQSLDKVASGGEMSRVMLALCSAISKKSGASTVVFDEIDTGVSGATSERIGKKLADIAKNRQVIAITHSAQIASLGDSHYKIVKSEVGGRAESQVILLDDKARVDEIARIIGGIDITDVQMDAAREMRENQKNNKLI